MIAFAPMLLKLRALPWRWIAAGALVLLAWWQIRAYADRVADAREAEVRALWADDTARRDKVAADAINAAEADRLAAVANNREVLTDANAQLAALAADRDSLDGLLRQARDQVRRLAAAEASNRLGADVIARIASHAAEVDQRLGDYDASCRRDAVRHQALIDQIRGQM
jgi:hypothetical protein